MKRYLAALCALAFVCFAQSAHAEVFSCASGSTPFTNGPCTSAVTEFIDLSGNAQSVDASHPLPVTLGSGTSSIGKVTPLGADGSTNSATHPIYTQPNTAGYNALVTLTRTNDTNAYIANDVVGAATGSTAALTFASMGPSAGEVMITSVALEIDATAIISGETSYRLYLYNVTPPSALGDNVAFDLPSGDRASYLGYVDLNTPVDLGSTLYVETNGVNKQVRLAGTSLFGYLVTIGPYTPTASRVHVVTIHTVAM